MLDKKFILVVFITVLIAFPLALKFKQFTKNNPEPEITEVSETTQDSANTVSQSEEREIVCDGSMSNREQVLSLVVALSRPEITQKDIAKRYSENELNDYKYFKEKVEDAQVANSEKAILARDFWWKYIKQHVDMRNKKVHNGVLKEYSDQIYLAHLSADKTSWTLEYNYNLSFPSTDENIDKKLLLLRRILLNREGTDLSFGIGSVIYKVMNKYHFSDGIIKTDAIDNKIMFSGIRDENSFQDEVLERKRSEKVTSVGPVLWSSTVYHAVKNALERYAAPNSRWKIIAHKVNYQSKCKTNHGFYDGAKLQSISSDIDSKSISYTYLIDNTVDIKTVIDDKNSQICMDYMFDLGTTVDEIKLIFQNANQQDVVHTMNINDCYRGDSLDSKSTISIPPL